MSNKIQNLNGKKKYDLIERTARFGENIIEFLANLPDTPVSRPLINQAVRSGTSIGSNYGEADGAESRNDFFHKIALCKKESKETMHWMRMLAKANPIKKGECRKLWKESQEFCLIFSSILKSKNKKK